MAQQVYEYSDSDSDTGPPQSASRPQHPEQKQQSSNRFQQSYNRSNPDTYSYSVHRPHSSYHRQQSPNEQKQREVTPPPQDHHIPSSPPASHRSSQSLHSDASHPSQQRQSQPQRKQQQSIYEYSDSSDDDDNKEQIQENKARSSVYHSNASSNTWNARPRNIRLNDQNFQIQSEHFDDDEKSVVPLSTIAPRRKQFAICERPHSLDDFPESHARPIGLIVNAIQARTGKISVSSLSFRFHK